MNRFWNKQNIPHKGWQLLECIDTETATNKCDMCDKEQIRYVHKMYHSEMPEYLYVGCVCAGHMTDAYTAQTMEKNTRKNTMRKNRWMKDNWNTLPIDSEKFYYYKSIQSIPWGVYELKDGWHYNIGTNHSYKAMATKQEALDFLYDVYKKVHLKK